MSDDDLEALEQSIATEYDGWLCGAFFRGMRTEGWNRWRCTKPNGHPGRHWCEYDSEPES
ncbi:hypothetical protein [Prauserella endophytica]|uniref:Uncharacterized protein n=1 Tax=Prauserella endophytica TaxID=1592324 RepID=A0ABY2S0S2_9PSEU|nr:hypothetical protein [Prauserella endophytica]TKG67034.1 hypothetical protein FCN18_24315 [Prauserella endophytica]